MMMLKKKCPTCKFLNEPGNMSCESCGADLSPDDLISIDDNDSGDSPNVSQEEVDSSGAQGEAPKTVYRTSIISNVRRRCSACGAIHKYTVQTCDCGAPMAAGEIVTDDEATDQTQCERKEFEATNPQAESYSRYALRSEDGHAELAIHPGDELIIGRGYELGTYLTDKSFVSNRHAIISLLEGRLRIMHVGKTNPTLVNGNIIEREKLYPLRAGDMIALGAQEGQAHVPKAAYFRVITMD